MVHKSSVHLHPAAHWRPQAGILTAQPTWDRGAAKLYHVCRHHPAIAPLRSGHPHRPRVLLHAGADRCVCLRWRHQRLRLAAACARTSQNELAFDVWLCRRSSACLACRSEPQPQRCEPAAPPLLALPAEERCEMRRRALANGSAGRSKPKQLHSPCTPQQSVFGPPTSALCCRCSSGPLSVGGPLPAAAGAGSCLTFTPLLCRLPAAACWA